jgi:hypothetical protein
MKKQGQQKSEIHPFNESGRRLLAALMSCQLRLASLDYTLKNYVPEVVNPYWADLAAQLLREMAESIGRQIGPQSSGLHSGPQKTERKM